LGLSESASVAPETLTGLALLFILLIAALTVVLLNRRWNILLSLLGGLYQVLMSITHVPIGAFRWT